MSILSRICAFAHRYRPRVDHARGIWGDPDSRIFRFDGFGFQLFHYNRWDASGGHLRGPTVWVKVLGIEVYRKVPPL
jgi:hypothetical protein